MNTITELLNFHQNVAQFSLNYRRMILCGSDRNVASLQQCLAVLQQTIQPKPTNFVQHVHCRANNQPQGADGGCEVPAPRVNLEEIPTLTTGSTNHLQRGAATTTRTLCTRQHTSPHALLGCHKTPDACKHQFPTPRVDCTCCGQVEARASACTCVFAGVCVQKYENKKL